MRRLTVPFAVVVTSLTIGGVARAGCCDDWLGCAATVVTGGLSCEIEETIATVQALVSSVQTLAGTVSGQTSDAVGQAQAAVAQSVSDMGQVRQQSVASLAQSVQTAHAIVAAKRVPKVTEQVIGHSTTAPVNAPHSTMQAQVVRPAGEQYMAPVVHPADPASALDAIARADKYIGDLQSKGNTQAAPVAQAETAATSAANRHVSVAQQISSAILMAPLNALEGMLADLLSHPERIFDPSAEIDAQMSNITNSVPALLVRIFNEVTTEATGILNQVQAPLQQLQDGAEGGSAVAAAMKKLADSGTQDNLDALDRLLPVPAPSGHGVTAQLALPPGIVGHHELVAAALTHTQPAKIPVYVQRKATLDDLNVKWASIKAKGKVPPHLEASDTQKADHELTAKFAGKSGADLEKTKQDLLNQAAKRFANEPKTLEKVRQYIEAHAKG